MIEFRGELTENAEKCFIEKNAKAAQIPLLIVLALSFPATIVIAIHTATVVYTAVRSLCIAYGIFLLWSLIYPYLPMYTKDILCYKPKEIYVKKQHIVCVSDKHTESKLIEDVKMVYDCGEYYDIRFIFGHYSSVFVCQKDLLVNGSLEL